mmetsp:Transcript_20606/g.40879  ORF Transcript_20606/g.40879 Transcript_20606/m.40879 type:complete len:118 (+) Transcript_20606:3-356(+)
MLSGHINAISQQSAWRHLFSTSSLFNLIQLSSMQICQMKQDFISSLRANLSTLHSYHLGQMPPFDLQISIDQFPLNTLSHSPLFFYTLMLQIVQVVFAFFETGSLPLTFVSATKLSS